MAVSDAPEALPAQIFYKQKANAMIDPLSLDTWLWALWALPFGLIVGSFSNVVYYRLPIMIEQDVQGLPPTLNLSLPRSHCPVCESTLSARDLVPVISYLAVGGRCRSCKTPIPKRYPLIELGFGLLAVVCAGIWGLSVTAGAAYAFWVVLSLSALIDAKSQWLPDVLTYTLLWAGVLAASLGALPTGVSLSASVWGVIAGYGLLASVDYALSIRHGHPSTLHLWWARRPLAADGLGKRRRQRA